MLKENPTPETRDWIRRKIESARWLIESIEQRYNTLRKVAQEIIDHQHEFLDKGPEFISAAEDAADCRSRWCARHHRVASCG
jgi:RNA polymerase sigma-54 factor